MAKKVKNTKLIRQSNTKPNLKTDQPSVKQSQVKSIFNNFAEKIQIAKHKKIQKINDTKNRLMSKKIENKMMKVPSHLSKSNKFNKFALLDGEETDKYEPTHKLTHRGANVENIKNFNDMRFDNDEDYDEGSFDQMHDAVNFHGFDDEEENVNNDPNVRKSKNQIYKEIIQKSKMHKRDRQEQYEENFNAAVELDDQFQDFVGQLKFRNNDAKVRDRIQKKDAQLQKLMMQLKEDERVVANRVVDNNKKGAQKVRKRKNQQLNDLMRNSDDEEEEDIRGWVKGINSDSEQDSNENQQESQQNEGSRQESEQDQLDDVELSSGDEEQEKDQDEGQDQEQGQEQQIENQDEQEIEPEEEQEQEQEQSESPVAPKGKNIKKQKQINKNMKNVKNKNNRNKMNKRK